jgi:hypothetical protein
MRARWLGAPARTLPGSGWRARPGTLEQEVEQTSGTRGFFFAFLASVAVIIAVAGPVYGLVRGVQGRR